MKRKGDDTTKDVTKKQKSPLNYYQSRVYNNKPNKDGFYYRRLGIHGEVIVHYIFMKNDTESIENYDIKLRTRNNTTTHSFKVPVHTSSLHNAPGYGFNNDGSVLAVRCGYNNNKPIKTYILNTKNGKSHCIESSNCCAIGLYNTMVVDTRNDFLHVDDTNTGYACNAKEYRDLFTNICVQNNIIAAIHTTSSPNEFFNEKKHISKLLLYNRLLKDGIYENLGNKEYRIERKQKSSITLEPFEEVPHIIMIPHFKETFYIKGLHKDQTEKKIKITPITPSPCIFKKSNFNSLLKELHILIWYKVAQLHWEEFKKQTVAALTQK